MLISTDLFFIDLTISLSNLLLLLFGFFIGGRVPFPLLTLAVFIAFNFCCIL
ncbi:membrane protein [Candidatus Omnitrophus magneticus]|uniref:Membrane protein n=1 Tax=Candidatus Omnitrophus magneticus TaxID=1609969 RepID=A0A0F0CP30_9BACT|nr:membrane protein [Candidatus Omnitrophus magneticus]